MRIFLFQPHGYRFFFFFDREEKLGKSYMKNNKIINPVKEDSFTSLQWRIRAWLTNNSWR
jgi:hypothetical protein